MQSWRVVHKRCRDALFPNVIGGKQFREATVLTNICHSPSPRVERTISTTFNLTVDTDQSDSISLMMHVVTVVKTLAKGLDSLRKEFRSGRLHEPRLDDRPVRLKHLVKIHQQDLIQVRTNRSKTKTDA